MPNSLDLANLQHQRPVAALYEKKQDSVGIRNILQLLQGLNWLAVDLDDDISRTQAALCGSTSGFDFRDIHAAGRSG